MRRRDAVRAFVRATFGLRGTVRLHRSAFGADLWRAPVNVMLAPVFLFTRLVVLLALFLRFHAAARRIRRWKILVETNVAHQVSLRVKAFFAELDVAGMGIDAAQGDIDRAVDDYAGIRNAVAEITTTVLVLIFGFVMFQSMTPGVISLAGPVAEMQARALAVAQFPLGDRLGGVYYGIFPHDLALWKVVLTGILLAMLASLITTFAGLIADPLQVLSGVHRRRLMRLIDRLEAGRQSNDSVAGEHITARIADITDIFVNVWRALRG